ncbi:LIM domain and actin-binding protein 1-like [Poecilia latipinna]|uniref:LIM domain and actin-binding protein 1-like n=1 Tax=Poecilia latipinna TaxID=48699 RepID=A0A3B3VYN5_9TELE|nr:PREDICTED: LIM domain and actin-binding protein 1-like [Poecilia latipinna]XP_014909614.1 PREDICTED: LIM domain and actin-binding protein 1-like [Poecilia latipinna]
MASVAPFSRRQWASQSLKVTAKELSIVSARGKNTAIAERFSKYQMAAEEGNAERKKTVVEPLPSSVSGGNLSVLKKRWEQQQQPSTSQSPSSSLLLTKPASRFQTQKKVLRSAGSSLEVHPENRIDPLTEEAEDLMEMEAKPGREVEEEAAAAETSDIEKPSVPINSLKMMFERGDAPDEASHFPSKVNLSAQ